VPWIRKPDPLDPRKTVVVALRSIQYFTLECNPIGNPPRQNVQNLPVLLDTGSEDNITDVETLKMYGLHHSIRRYNGGYVSTFHGPQLHIIGDIEIRCSLFEHDTRIIFQVVQPPPEGESCGRPFIIGTPTMGAEGICVRPRPQSPPLSLVLAPSGNTRNIDNRIFQPPGSRGR